MFKNKKKTEDTDGWFYFMFGHCFYYMTTFNLLHVVQKQFSASPGLFQDQIWIRSNEFDPHLF